MPHTVLPHESQEEYDSLEGVIVNRFKPADELEMDLVKEMAGARWRLRRIEAMEAALFEKAFGEQREHQGPDADPGHIRDAAYAGLAESKSMRILICTARTNFAGRSTTHGATWQFYKSSARRRKHKNFQTNPRGRS